MHNFLKLVLIGLISLSSSAYALPGKVTFFHEEDTWNGCNLSEVGFPVDDLSDFIADNNETILHYDEAIAKNPNKQMARINLVYNKSGEYIGTFINKSRPAGIPLGHIIDIDKSSFNPTQSNLVEIIATSGGIETFTFNDPIQDLKRVPTKIDLHTQHLIPIILYESGVLKPENHGLLARYQYAFKESVREMDYMVNFRSYTLLDGVLYNQFDAGNFTWGAGMNALGFTYLEAKAGSETNGFLFTRSQNSGYFGLILTGDSNKDQAAIARGFSSIYPEIEDTSKYVRYLFDFYVTGPNANGAVIDKILYHVKHSDQLTTDDKYAFYEEVLELPNLPESVESHIIHFVGYDLKKAEKDKKLLEILVTAKSVTPETKEIAKFYLAELAATQ